MTVRVLRLPAIGVPIASSTRTVCIFRQPYFVPSLIFEYPSRTSFCIEEPGNPLQDLRSWCQLSIHRHLNLIHLLFRIKTIMPATTAETLSLVSRQVSVAPLVLLSAADHYGRSAKGTRKRVVGVLLGQNDGKNVRVSNCFAGMSRSLKDTDDDSDSEQFPSKKMKRTPLFGS